MCLIFTVSFCLSYRKTHRSYPRHYNEVRDQMTPQLRGYPGQPQEVRDSKTPKHRGYYWPREEKSESKNEEKNFLAPYFDQTRLTAVDVVQVFKNYDSDDSGVWDETEIFEYVTDLLQVRTSR